VADLAGACIVSVRPGPGTGLRMRHRAPRCSSSTTHSPRCLMPSSLLRGCGARSHSVTRSRQNGSSAATCGKVARGPRDKGLGTKQALLRSGGAVMQGHALSPPHHGMHTAGV
jgi:hypothetical protein